MGGCVEKIQTLYSLGRFVSSLEENSPCYLVVRCQCAVIFYITRAEIWSTSIFWNKRFCTILLLKTLTWEFSKARNLKSKDVTGFAHSKRKRSETECVSFCFYLLSSQMHAEFCLNSLNLYLVSWWLNFIFSATNCDIKKLLNSTNVTRW